MSSDVTGTPVSSEATAGHTVALGSPHPGPERGKQQGTGTVGVFVKLVAQGPAEDGASCEGRSVRGTRDLLPPARGFGVERAGAVGESPSDQTGDEVIVALGVRGDRLGDLPGAGNALVRSGTAETVGARSSLCA